MNVNPASATDSREDSIQKEGGDEREFNEYQIELIREVVSAGVPSIEEPVDVFMYAGAYALRLSQYERRKPEEIYTWKWWGLIRNLVILRFICIFCLIVQGFSTLLVINYIVD
jgi:hypothetical protein